VSLIVDLMLGGSNADQNKVVSDEDHSTVKRDAVLGILAILGTIASGMFAWNLITATPAPVVAPALPAPATSPPLGNLSPTVTRPALPGATLAPLGSADPMIDGIERAVEGNLAPWQSQAIDVVTGWPLAPADFTMDVTLVNSVIAAVPTPWSFSPLDSETIPTPAGDIDLAWAESTQPFRARQLRNASGGLVARVWVFAGASEHGVDYVRRARDRWNPGTTADHLSLPGTIIVSAIVPPADDSTGGTWFASLSRNVAVLVEAAPTVTQRDVVAFLLEWRSAFTGS